MVYINILLILFSGLVLSAAVSYLFFTKKKKKLHNVYAMWWRHQDDELEFKEWQVVHDFKDNILACYACYIFAVAGFFITINL